MNFTEIFMNSYEGVLHVIAEFLVCTLELVGMLIIIVGSANSLIHIFTNFKNKHKINIIIDLGKSLALALEFKIGAEIANTVIVRSLSELGTLAIVIALRATLSLLIHWEIINERKAELNEALSEKQK